MPDASFPKSVRLLKRSEFDGVFASRRSIRDKSIRICGRRNGTGTTRLGLAVGKRVGNAVARNRWKRLLREAFRLSRAELPAGLDLVVIPVRATPPAMIDIRAAINSLAQRLHAQLEENDR